ncbi:MAG: hypothetical protein R3E12_01325 [Candidatus Eisenbacteria bacterium]|uniref:Uncharacterized protein n=1 Tax=Eiseniibacteriota bacterium TaxID=2212470 RepID=A0A956RQ00_UNCEI|nr:hypothetical protein [Candidatus Eisenbacteria bacterium]
MRERTSTTRRGRGAGITGDRRLRTFRRPLREPGSILLGLSLLAFAGCGVLDTRTAEPPDVTIEIPYSDPLEPGIVLDNIKATLQAKSTNNYGTSLHDDFTFQPADVDAADFAVNLPWTKDKEVAVTDAFLNDFLSETGLVGVTWDVPSSTLEAGQSDTGERQVYYQDLGYTLTFQLGILTRTYSGSCDMYFREGAGGFWSIYDWQDKEDGSGNATWGRLRIDRRVVFQ